MGVAESLTSSKKLDVELAISKVESIQSISNLFVFFLLGHVHLFQETSKQVLNKCAYSPQEDALRQRLELNSSLITSFSNDFAHLVNESASGVLQKFKDFSDELGLKGVVEEIERKTQEKKGRVKVLASCLEEQRAELIKMQDVYEKSCIEAKDSLSSLEKTMKEAASLYTFSEIDGKRRNCLGNVNLMRSYEAETKEKMEKINEKLKEIEEMTANSVKDVGETYSGVIQNTFEGVRKTTKLIYQAASEIIPVSNGALECLKIYEKMEKSYLREDEYLKDFASRNFDQLKEKQNGENDQSRRGEGANGEVEGHGKAEGTNEEEKEKEAHQSINSANGPVLHCSFLDGIKLADGEHRDYVVSSFYIKEDPLILLVDSSMLSADAYLRFFELTSVLYESLESKVAGLVESLGEFLGASTQLGKRNGLTGPEDTFYTKAFRLFDAHVIYILNNFFETFNVLKKNVSMVHEATRAARDSLKILAVSRKKEFSLKSEKLHRLILALRQTRDSYLHVKSTLDINSLTKKASGTSTEQTQEKMTDESVPKDTLALLDVSPNALELPPHLKVIRENLYGLSLQTLRKLESLKITTRKSDSDTSKTVSASLQRVYSSSMLAAESVIQHCGMVSSLNYAQVPQVVLHCLKIDQEFLKLTEKEFGLGPEQLLRFQPRLDSQKMLTQLNGIESAIHQVHLSGHHEEETKTEANVTENPNQPRESDPQMKKQGFLATVASNLGVGDNFSLFHGTNSRGRSVSLGNQFKLTPELAKKFGVSEKDIIRGKFVCVKMKKGIPVAGHIYLLERKFCFEPAISIGGASALGVVWSDILGFEKKDGRIDKALEVKTKYGSISFKGVIHREELVEKSKEIMRIMGLGENQEEKKGGIVLEYREEEGDSP